MTGKIDLNYVPPMSIYTKQKNAVKVTSRETPTRRRKNTVQHGMELIYELKYHIKKPVII